MAIAPPKDSTSSNANASTDKPKRTRAKKGEGTPAPTRPYEISMAVDGTLDEVVEKLKELVGPDETVKLRLYTGSATASTPKGAIMLLADDKELSGDYNVTAEKAITPFKNVRVVKKPSVKFD